MEARTQFVQDNSMEKLESSPYKYEAMPLSSSIAKELLLMFYADGKPYSRAVLNNRIIDVHKQLGGIITKSNTVVIKKPLNELINSNLAERVANGYYRIFNNDYEEAKDIIQTTIEIVKTNEPSIELPKRLEQIYVYTFPTYVELSLLKNDSQIPMKIGRTSTSSEMRINGQTTGMPERHLTILTFEVEDSILVERMIHDYFKFRKMDKKDSPGSEWFVCNIEDLLLAIEILFNNVYTVAIEETYINFIERLANDF